MGSRSSRLPKPGRLPWTRVLAALVIGLPALWIGGVPPWAVVAVLGLQLLLWIRLCRRSTEPLRIPYIAVLLFLGSAYTLLQWAPISGLRESLAPGLDELLTTSLTGSGVEPRPGLSVSPADTGLEAARLLALAALAVTAAQLSWRVTTATIASLGTLVALIGLAQEVLGLDRIYGLYAARDIDLAGVPALMGTFVNPNHQSGLLLLGLACAASLALDQHLSRLTTRDATQAEVHRDRFLAALGMLLLQVPALVLSLSRGALIAFVLVLPAIGWLGLRRGKTEKRADPRRGLPVGVRMLVGAGVLVVFAIVAQHGALDELSTLWSPSELRNDDKIEIALQAPVLLEHSGTLGIARGTFIDLFASVQDPPSRILYTHLESSPMAAYVEWGPFFGPAFVIGMLGWWLHAMWYGGHRTDRRARRIALFGVLALGIQSVGDFSLDFLGVAAPAAALVGALSPPRWLPWSSRTGLVAGGALLVGAIALAATTAPGVWSRRAKLNASVLAGDTEVATALRQRPLDGALHAIAARRDLDAGEPAKALERATVATRLRPGNLDAWLVRSEAERRLDDGVASEVSLRRSLALLAAPPTADLLAYVVERYPVAAEIGAVAPRERWPWRLLVDALLVDAPAHADALCAARAEQNPTESEPLRLRVNIAVIQRRAAPALHHARLLAQLAPDEAASHLAMVAALEVQPADQNAKIRDLLEEVLGPDGIEDPAARGTLEEPLVRVLLRLGDQASLQRADEVVRALVSRPARPDLRRRRRKLAEHVRKMIRDAE